MELNPRAQQLRAFMKQRIEEGRSLVDSGQLTDDQLVGTIDHETQVFKFGGDGTPQSQ